MHTCDFVAETSWLAKVKANPTESTNSVPLVTISNPTEAIPLSSTSSDDAKKDHAPPPSKKTRAGKGKAQISQESASLEEVTRCKYPTRRSQSATPQPVDVDSYPLRLSTSKFFSEFISSQECDQMLQLPPDQQRHQATNHFAKVSYYS